MSDGRTSEDRRERPDDPAPQEPRRQRRRGGRQAARRARGLGQASRAATTPAAPARSPGRSREPLARRQRAPRHRRARMPLLPGVPGRSTSSGRPARRCARTWPRRPSRCCRPRPALLATAGRRDRVGATAGSRRSTSTTTTSRGPRTGGRPMSLTVGVDVGGTKIAGGVVDEDGHVLARSRGRSRRPRTPRRSSATIEDLVAELRAAARRRGRRGRRGRLRRQVAVDRAVRAQPRLARRADLQAEPRGARRPAGRRRERRQRRRLGRVHASAPGEDVDDLLLVTVGTGVGGGMVLDGELHRGAFGVGGEIGHMRVVPDGLPVRLRQPRLLGAVRQRHGAGPRGPRRGAAAGPCSRRGAARPGRRRRRADHRPAGHRGRPGRRPVRASSSCRRSATGSARASPR